MRNITEWSGFGYVKAIRNATDRNYSRQLVASEQTMDSIQRRRYSGSPTYTANWPWFMVGNLLEEVHLLHGPQLPLSENPLPRPGLGQLVQACEVVSHALEPALQVSDFLLHCVSLFLPGSVFEIWYPVMGRLLIPKHLVCLQEGDHQLLLLIGKLVVLLVFSSHNFLPTQSVSV